MPTSSSNHRKSKERQATTTRALRGIKSPGDLHRKKELGFFQRGIGIRFKHVELLELALTHRSFSSIKEHTDNNERLEFLGDSVLGLAVADWLYHYLGDKAEGDLARVKSVAVSEECLSTQALAIGLEKYLVMGKGEELSGGRAKKAILADAMEAIIGAFYLDSGYESCRKLVIRLLEAEMLSILSQGRQRDHKSVFQEYAQKEKKEQPRYVLTRRQGPDHDRTFWVRAELGGRSYAEGEGKSKKEAEQEAARLAYLEIMGKGD